MGMDQEVHKACDREHGGLTEEIRQRRGITLREDGRKILLMSSMILGTISRKVLDFD